MIYSSGSCNRPYKIMACGRFSASFLRQGTTVIYAVRKYTQQQHLKYCHDILTGGQVRCISGLGPLITSPESIEKAIQSWQKQVQLDKLSPAEKAIHALHVDALKVGHLILFIV